jgi:hypothetical protein
VSSTAHSDAPNIEAGVVQGPSLSQIFFEILIATPANRNALNSPNINETYRSNRNKMRGGRRVNFGSAYLREGEHSPPSEGQMLFDN